jgi:hypothetical protein
MSAVEDGADGSRGISRRTLLGGGVGLGVGVALGTDFIAPSAANAAGPTSASGVISLGRSYLGLGLKQVRALTDSPWAGYPNADWCAWFVSWISRGLGYGYQTYANAWDFLPSPPSDEAKVGDFARIGTGSGAIHIGVVTAVSGGRVTKILDGNRIRPPATYWGNSYVREEGPYAPYVLRRPTYPNTTEPSEGDIEMRTIYNKDNPNDNTRRATIGELTFTVDDGDQSRLERMLWGVPVDVTQGEWDGLKAGVNARRAANGLPAI